MDQLELCLFLGRRDALADSPVQSSVPPGISFFTLAEAGDDFESRERLYHLVRQGVIDTPGFVGEFETFADFNDRLFVNSYWSHRNSQFLAGMGGEWVGLSSLTLNGERQAEFGLTVVRRDWRGRGLARALKERAIEYAKWAGVEFVRTRNHPDNVPILTLNKSLGFRPPS